MHINYGVLSPSSGADPGIPKRGRGGRYFTIAGAEKLSVLERLKQLSLLYFALQCHRIRVGGTVIHSALQTELIL